MTSYAIIAAELRVHMLIITRLRLTDADPPLPHLAQCHPPLLPVLLHPQQRWASWVGQGEGAGQGVPLQTFGLVGLQLHHLHGNAQFLEAG